jgi:hypothetical protein
MKTIFNSKTMWAGGATVLLGILEHFNVVTFVQNNSGVILVLIGIGFIILRKLTKQEIQ